MTAVTAVVRVRGPAALLALALVAASAAAGEGKAAGPGSASRSPAAVAAEGEAVRASLEALEAEVGQGLSLLAESLRDFEADRRGWTALDRSIDAARRVNRAVGERNKTVVRLYDSFVAGALARFEAKLSEAPAVYRRMAADRRQFLADSTLELERRSYLAMAELCESAAVLCERRHEELFGGGAPTGGFAARPRRKNAVTLAETVDNMRKLSLVHDRWEETFAAYPSSLEDGKLSALFEHLSAYAEDLEAFTKGVEALKDAMKQKAAGAGQPTAPPPPPDRNLAVARPPAGSAAGIRSGDLTLPPAQPAPARARAVFPAATVTVTRR